MSYMMESPEEAARLLAQARASPVEAHLRRAGLRPGARALDAGCGPGAITRIMGEVVGAAGEVVALDAGAARVAEAQRQCADLAHVRVVEGDVCRLDLPDAHFDFVWSQFVLEYLPQPERAVAELVRVAKPGGRVVVSDVDGVGQLNWPFPEALQAGFAKLVAGAATTGFDIHVGRKMFHHFRRAGLRDIQVRVETLWMMAGAADARVLEDWSLRLKTLAGVATPLFGSQAAYDAFCAEYLALLRDPDALKYTVYLVTEGTK